MNEFCKEFTWTLPIIRHCNNVFILANTLTFVKSTDRVTVDENKNASRRYYFSHVLLENKAPGHPFVCFHSVRVTRLIYRLHVHIFTWYVLCEHIKRSLNVACRPGITRNIYLSVRQNVTHYANLCERQGLYVNITCVKFAYYERECKNIKRIMNTLHKLEKQKWLYCMSLPTVITIL